MGIYFGGFDELNDKLERMTKEGAAKRDKFVVQEAEILISHAKDNTPVQTRQPTQELETDTGRSRQGHGLQQRRICLTRRVWPSPTAGAVRTRHW